MIRFTKDVIDWSSQVDRCQICWASRGRVQLQRAHIVSRRYGCHDRHNLVIACSLCHIEGQHGMDRPDFPALTVAHLLAVKLESDPLHYDPKALDDLLWGRREKRPGAMRLPWPMPLPQEYLDERLRNRPMAFSY